MKKEKNYDVEDRDNPTKQSYFRLWISIVNTAQHQSLMTFIKSTWATSIINE
jgi:ribosomal protein L20